MPSRQVSTASSCIMHTPIRWHRSYRAPTLARTAMAGRAKAAFGCRLKSLPRFARRVGKDFAVGCRFLADECIEGGSSLDDAVYFGVAFRRARAWISSRPRAAASSMTPSNLPSAPPPILTPAAAAMNACRNSFPMNAGRSAAMPKPTAAIRKAIRDAGSSAPVVVHRRHPQFRDGGGLCWRAASAISSARHGNRSPIRDWFRKIALGCGDTVRVCEYTNYCEGLDQKHKPVTCQLWDKLPSSGAERRTPDGKRRMTAPASSPPE